MNTDQQQIFGTLFPRAPLPLQHFLRNALKVSDLEDLYREARRSNPRTLSEAILQLLDVKLQLDPADLQRIPKEGPVIVVANHPFGLLDGMLLDFIVSTARPDLRTLTNSVLCGMSELQDRTIPISVFGGDEQASTNHRAIRSAVSWLREGHCIATFPSGEVSHWNPREKRVTDPQWSEFPARCARLAKAAVVPLYFEGSNSVAFQVTGALHPRFRTVRLPAELLNKQGRHVRVRVGNVVRSNEMRELGDPARVTAYLRARTYVLRHREARNEVDNTVPASRQKPIPICRAATEISREIDQLSRSQRVLASETYDVFAARGHEIPALLKELGRLREINFRAVGEGSGNSLDLDRFDPYYTHLILWNKADRAVAGAYRLAWTCDVLARFGRSGLYTSTLFRFAPQFFSRLGPAVELGRSFICAEYQKSFAPLLLLWQAIAHCVAHRPEAPVLFGPVSISAEYSDASREMIVQFLKERRYCSHLAPLVKARQPFRSRLVREKELMTVATSFQEIEDLAAPIRDLDPQPGVPVLLRQYLKMGGRVAGFNVDRKFGNALDGLLVVDLREASDKILTKYMGSDLAATFRAQIALPHSA